VATLHLFPSTEGLETVLRGLVSDGGAIELGRRHATLSQVVESAHDAHPLSGTRLGTHGERLLIDKVANEINSGDLYPIAHSRGLRRGLPLLFSSFRRLGLSAKELAHSASVVGGTALDVVRALERYENLLNRPSEPPRALPGLFDEAAVFARAVENITRGWAIPILEDVEAVELHGMYDWDPPRLALMDALLERGLVVRVRLPEWQPAELGDLSEVALRPLFEALEARHRYSNLERVTEVSSPSAVIGVLAAASPFIEVRAVAQQVRDLCDRGVRFEEIGVVAATPDRRARLLEMMQRYQIPVEDKEGCVATEGPPVRLVLNLYSLLEEGIPRDRLVALLASQYLGAGFDGPSGPVRPHRLARALRQSGARSMMGEGYRPHLLAWARGERDGAEAHAIVNHLCHLLDALCSLPKEATIAGHTKALLILLERLELFPRTRRFRPEDGPMTSEEARLFARDQGATRALEAALTELPFAANRARIRDEPLLRLRFSRILGEVLAISRLRSGAARGAAVQLGAPAQFIGIRLRHLFICGLVDGELPSRGAVSSLLLDEDRLALGRAFGRPLLPLEGRREFLDALHFSQLLSCAEQVVLSFHRGNDEGAPVLVSPLLEPFLERSGADGAIVREIGRDPLPRIREARSLHELWARASLEVHGQASSRLSRSDREGRLLYKRLAAIDPARTRRIEARVEIERMRSEYFAGERGPHVYVGLLGEEVRSLLGARVPGGESQPFSAAVIENYASCHFRYLLRLLHIAPFEEADEELDPISRGQLFHQVLERLFRRLGQESLLPIGGRGGERFYQAFEEVLANVVHAWQENNPVGHPALFRVFVERIRQQTMALLRAEEKNPPAPGCTPRLFEHAFGPLPIPSAVGEAPIYIRGIIDRVDIGVGHAVVFDYKSGARDRYRAKLDSEALCRTAWQLPLYAAAVRVEQGIEDVRAAFYSLRDARPTAHISDPGLIALDAPGCARRREAGEVHLGDALHALVGQIRTGLFEVAPKDDACIRCRMQIACRVVSHPDPGGLGEEASS
jgi:hypothetical protein